MLSARLAWLPVTAALLLSFVASVTPANAADRVDARFEIIGFAGFHVLTNLTTTQETSTGYSIAMNLDTRGLAAAFVDLRSNSTVQGMIGSNGLHPDAYRADVYRNGTQRYYGVKYQKDGNVVDDSSPPPAGVTRPSGAQVRGTVDQLTAYFLVERQLAQRGQCALVVPVFDGSELYKIHFSDVGQETLSADRFQNFTGAAKRCEINREVIVASPDKEESTYQQGRIWYAQLLPGHAMIPVRMEYDTAFGRVSGYLAELTAEGVHLQLMGE